VSGEGVIGVDPARGRDRTGYWVKCPGCAAEGPPHGWIILQRHEEDDFASFCPACAAPRVGVPVIDVARMRQRHADADFIDGFAASLSAGPRKRESWETALPNERRHDPETIQAMVPMLRGIAGSIRTGLADASEEGQ